jgi:uncharacterized membrane-anchored protein
VQGLGRRQLRRSIRELFQGKSLVGSSGGGNAEVWTDFLIHPDGFSRFVVRDLHLREFQPAAWSAACWKSKPTA